MPSLDRVEARLSSKMHWNNIWKRIVWLVSWIVCWNKSGTRSAGAHERGTPDSNEKLNFDIIKLRKFEGEACEKEIINSKNTPLITKFTVRKRLEASTLFLEYFSLLPIRRNCSIVNLEQWFSIDILYKHVSWFFPFFIIRRNKIETSRYNFRQIHRVTKYLQI